MATFSGQAIRPTSDRVREALFSMLLSRLGSFNGISVLDLYAGTGALGIEALSRGAKHCTFVDQSREAANLVQKNLDHVGLAMQAQVINERVETRIPQLPVQGFDLILIDPPYADPGINAVLVQASEANLLSENGILCLETAAGCPLPERAGPLLRRDQRRYGTTMVSLYSPEDQKETSP